MNFQIESEMEARLEAIRQEGENAFYGLEARL